MIGVGSRASANLIVDHAEQRGVASATSGLRQDKRPHIAAWTVGCFCWLFYSYPHIAGHVSDVRAAIFPNVFNEYCTLWEGMP